MSQRFLLSVWLSITFAGTICAQKGFEIGTTTTFNGSFITQQNLFQTLDGTPVYQGSKLAYHFTFGYNIGITLAYNFNDKYGIFTSLTYNKAGEHWADVFHPANNVPLPISRYVDLGYMQVPLFFKYDFFRFKERYRLYVMTGPEFGFLVNSQETITVNGVQKTEDIPASYEFKEVDIGWGMGIGIDIYMRQDLYFEAGALGYISMLDINTDLVKEQPWFAANDVKYLKSYNSHPGIDVGIHFLFNREAHNPFSKKGGNSVQPVRKSKANTEGE